MFQLLRDVLRMSLRFAGILFFFRLGVANWPAPFTVYGSTFEERGKAGGELGDCRYIYLML